MRTIKNENVVYIDVDDTLVLWLDKPFEKKPIDSGYVKFIQHGTAVYLKPHEKHVQLIKSFYSRGYFIVVHSASGYEWAEHVVNTLLLSPYVDMVMTKPSGYVDDKESSEWMQRIYVNEEGLNE